MIYFVAFDTKFFFNMFIWFWFFLFVEHILMLGFVTFSYSFRFVELECSGMLALRLWKSFLFLSLSNWVISWVFCRPFTGIWISFLLSFISSASRFAETSYLLTLLLLQLKWLISMYSRSSGCGESRSRLQASWMYIYNVYLLRGYFFWMHFSLTF